MKSHLSSLLLSLVMSLVLSVSPAFAFQPTVIPVAVEGVTVAPADLEDLGAYHVVLVVGKKAVDLIHKWGGKTGMILHDEKLIVLCDPGQKGTKDGEIRDLGIYNLKLVHGETRVAMAAKYGKMFLYVDTTDKVLYIPAREMAI